MVLLIQEIIKYFILIFTEFILIRTIIKLLVFTKLYYYFCLKFPYILILSCRRCYFEIFINLLIILSFIAPSAEKGKTTSSVIRDGIYNYITCLDTSINYLVNNVPSFSKIAEIHYSKAYNKVMGNRSFVKHMVFAGETLDDIIKRYNSNIEDIESFRKVVYKENPGIVSSSYEIKSGDYITVPTDQ